MGAYKVIEIKNIMRKHPKDAHENGNSDDQFPNVLAKKSVKALFFIYIME
ncbi:hypothetical protein JCM31826_11140 [Thermaurantimonas aggregans]|uniref:Uncharacterized protein n=1 Tax=Thermaurantimonas aggregans TaxID=2173829 RepID=A0A401XKV4_9FLAO|nr:hypothetical protein JCM31826_11140 [Thermaurantimonas aggregans]